MLNLNLMRHWENWVTILLMVVIGSFVVNLSARCLLEEMEG